MGKGVFNKYQQQEIEEGIRQKVDVSVYAKPQFLAIQMRQIRIGLEEHLPMEQYARPEYDWFQLEEIRLGLKSGVDVKKYDNPDISYELMRQIRLGLESGIDLSSGLRFPAGVLRQLRIASCEHVDIRSFIKEGYDEEQLIPIRLAVKEGINLAPYISLANRGSAIREIALGLERGLDVSKYTRDEFNWLQMREIRQGLEKRLDVSYYNNPLYSWQQMQEIRLGLEEDLPVEQYSSLMYTPKEMEKRRLSLLESDAEQVEERQRTVQHGNLLLMISEDWMEASILLTDDGETDINQEEICSFLNENGIVAGLNYQEIEELSKKNKTIITVARGTAPGKGKNGWYEYFFETNVKHTPKMLENGSVDYQNVKWFEVVKKGQKVAYYHSAERGTSGQRIDGKKIRGEFGDELPAIEGRGITRLNDQRTYAATVDGKIELSNGKLIVSELLILENVTRINGNIDFKGSVYIKGSIQQGVCIKAQKDILVDGFIESARLEAGGDIILRNGNNAGGHGFISAAGSVMGRFFENAHIEAGEDIRANYCLNSELKAAGSIVISGNFGTLAGGKYEAGVSISSHYIGNETGILTVLKVGNKELFLQKYNQLEQQKTGIQKELKLLSNAYFDFQKKLSPEIRNTNDMYLKIESAIYTKQQEMKKVKHSMYTLNEEIKKCARANIRINGTLYGGVFVNIDGAQWKATMLNNVTLKNVESKISLIRNN